VAGRQHQAEPWVIVAAEGGPSATWSFDPECRSLEEEDAKVRFKSEEERNGLPAGLLEAVARQESALYPCAVSRAGALGLMQLMPATANELGVANPASRPLRRRPVARFGGLQRGAVPGGSLWRGPAHSRNAELRGQRVDENAADYCFG
jgi:hypothetical protein